GARSPGCSLPAHERPGPARSARARPPQRRQFGAENDAPEILSDRGWAPTKGEASLGQDPLRPPNTKPIGRTGNVAVTMHRALAQARADLSVSWSNRQYVKAPEGISQSYYLWFLGIFEKVCPACCPARTPTR